MAIFRRGPPNGDCYEKSRFLTNISLYRGDDTKRNHYVTKGQFIATQLNSTQLDVDRYAYCTGLTTQTNQLKLICSYWLRFVAICVR